MIQLDLRLFGGFAASVAGEAVTQFRTDKMRALLAYLAMNGGRPFRRELLATLLWPDWSDEDARRNLRQTLHRLRQMLDKLAPDLGKDLFTTTRQTVQLNGTAVSLDVTHFQHHLQAIETHAHTSLQSCTHCLAQMQQAAALYQGDLLAGFNVKDAFPFEEWLIMQREQHQQQMLELLDKLALTFTQQGDYGQAQRYANQQVSLAPWRESAHRQLMQLYMLQDQRSKALAQYESCRTLLMQELAVEPSAETTQLWQQIKEDRFQTAVSPSTIIYGFPAQLTPFIGRQEIVAQIMTQLADASCRLLTLIGSGGVGKTRLSIQVGQVLAHAPQRFKDGAYFIPLAAVTDEAMLVTMITQSLGIRLTEQMPPKQQLLTYLQDKAILLVCDNFEQILPGAALLGEIVAQAPQVQLLVTSRQPLNLHAEWRQIIGGLDYSQGESSEAVRFFQRSARRVAPYFQWRDEDLTAVLELCRLVDGLPLALELAAAWTRLMDCPTILRETQKSLDFLASPLDDFPERHQSIRAVLNQSWQMLPTRLQTILAQLTHFAGSFSLDAALIIVPDLSMLDLATLLDRSLLQWQPNGRYTLHELLRQFTTQQLTNAPRSIAQQHSHYYLSFLASQEVMLVGEQSPTAVAQIRHEVDNIHLAWHTAVAHRAWDSLQNSLESLATYYSLTGNLPELETLLNQTLKQIPVADAKPDFHGALLEKLAIIYTRQARYPEATATAQKLLALGSQQPTQALAMRAQIILGELHLLKGEYEAAMAAYETAVAYFTDTGNTARQAQLSNLLGHLEYLQGNFDLALAQHQQALVLSRELGNIVQQAKVLLDMGNIYTAQSDANQALDHFQQALDINQKINHRDGTARTLHSMGRIYLQQGKNDDALSCFQEALTLTEKMGLRRAVSLSLNSIGIVYKRQSRYAKATDYYQRALKINRELGVQAEIANNLSNLGNVYVHQKQYDLAESSFREAVQIAEAINHPEGLVGHLGNLAVLYKVRGDWQAAIPIFERAIPLARRLKAKYTLAYLLIVNGELLLDLERPSEAQSLATEGTELAESIHATALVARGEQLCQQLSE
ncbi:AfsR/SARP family transcriptional regulator [Candidatus Leptofilum sp.]|uniref:AfsR/SARP family transcriptional regulator n=1 Tax=Candidatus Leptofilum sp. TaxID=3241576 RepID=UPI003B5A8CE1